MHKPMEVDLVIFGGTGDLAMRKLLPALYHLYCDGLLASGARIVGVAREELDRAAYQASARQQCEGHLGKNFSESKWEGFTAQLYYCTIDARKLTSYASLAECLGSRNDRDRVFYLSTSAALFADICRNLSETGLISPQSRVVLEKPLGHDLESSRQINDQVGQFFHETQIYRIDHYLGKEPVQNLLALRFGNALFEPLWRRDCVRDVQITVAEQLGVESRGEFYDGTGALRDMLQNHLLQLLCIVAMEPPASIAPDVVRDEKLKILRALRPIKGHDVAAKTVRGQYRAGAIAGKPVRGYLEEDDVPNDSDTETFVSIKAEIDTWRWAGVPFFLRTGKRMQEKLAEIVVNFREPPHTIFNSPVGAFTNRMVIRMQPEETVELHLLAKQPGEEVQLRPVQLNLDFSETFRTRRLEAYERLLIDVMRANLTLFVRRDEQEAAWSWVESIMAGWQASQERPRNYTAGTWGPAASNSLMASSGLQWHEEI
ncbi:glucose-6-phosphate dehydrogenase [Noviherbaspirillum sedimenti]|uniref:Glucose-6-phosphate 1-dehydrogenase n=1 Tax=Noviherbaspirillum sedimenti TaxID=2320865 RepID=A0A3A3G1M2_9BURK|nr:glucose-6-phosphate dehydrogenase [Noviherbaspirillum sedimenti]RJG01794.1 glucose-6-phosphate dehydrogenase [Noviherbaspirillum sedimenti]